MMETISSEDQKILDCMQKAVSDALERKRRLGQYAVIWEDGRPVIIGGVEQEMEAIPHLLTDVHCVERIVRTLDEPTTPAPKKRQPHPEIAGKGRTLGDLVAPIVDKGDWECLK